MTGSNIVRVVRSLYHLRSFYVLTTNSIVDRRSELGLEHAITWIE